MGLLTGWQSMHKTLRKALPGYCAFCLASTEPGQGWCTTCLVELPWNVKPCTHCADPLRERDQSLCAHCLQEPPPITHTQAALLYQAAIKELIYDFKFNAFPRAGMLLVELMLKAMPRHPGAALLAVPMHPKRARERGFNQAQWLAEQLSRRTGLPLLQAECHKLVVAQRTLNRQERAANLRGAFRMAKDTHPLPAHIMLVDDVVTTGATGNALADVVLDAGAERVDMWAVARTPLGNN
ncbi:ComF family protein [Vreelandella songnenensis]|uniref:ComF family protein n=2 Tax=Vreelandella songnenensis TaxID=1176243 RepID=A0A2T0V6B7_9GAMM|nr:ComF family protein [Halomonas songnenensis]